MLKKKLGEVLSKVSNSNKHPVQKKQIILKVDPFDCEMATIFKDSSYDRTSNWEFLYGRGIHIEEFTTSNSEWHMSIQLLDNESVQTHTPSVS